MEGNNGRASVAVVIPCFNDGATLVEAVADYVFPLEADDLVAHGALGRLSDVLSGAPWCASPQSR